MKPWHIFLSVIVGLVVIALAGVGYAWQQLSPTGVAKTVIEVKPGMGLGAIASALESAKLVRSADLFRLAARLAGADREVKEGYYDLDGSLGAVDIARKLSEGGRPRVVKVTIPEGWRYDEIAQRLEETKFGSRDAYLKLFATTALEPNAASAKNLEGFLFPATYEFRPEDTPEAITKTLLARFDREATPTRLERLRALKLSVFQWVTLASIVQVEAGNTEEMPVIAGVFLNRLDDGMPLGSDPTVAYGLGKKLPELSRPDGDFEKDTPYNTYTRQGLPVGPISNPGAAALESVLSAQRTAPSGKRWLYFLHGLKGEFRPNTDFQAHLRDTAKFR